MRCEVFNINMQEHKPLRELVYEELRMLIMTGKIKPGVKMMEIELADSMGVSRTPVREAIRQLEKENLVTIVESVHSDTSLETTCSLLSEQALHFHFLL